MSRLTGAHVGQSMAIVLDGQVYSAPNLLGQIGSNGMIEGDFSPEQINYLTRVLAAGALSARLSEQPIAINTLGPSIGADNLARGLKAFVLSIVVTSVIMLVYYFFAGLVANIALFCNAIVIFGVMALLDASFTLPGLAGVALSIAMAVDANVLIYERIREELVNNREDLRTAIRLGYNRAMSAIIDGNLTHLITCVVLLYTATTEVKGFAVTMILGVLATLFTALFITRVIFTFYTEYFRAKRLPMLATVFPAIHRALEPSFNWIGKRRIFYACSAVASIIALGLVFSLGSRILDTEFRGGVSLTMQTRPARSGEPADQSAEKRLLLSRPEVERQIHALGEAAGPDQPAVRELRSAIVLTVGETGPDYQASRFQIKVSNPPGISAEASVDAAVQNAIATRFADVLDVTPKLDFAGRDVVDHSAFTFPIEEDVLGANIGMPEVTQAVRSFRGGVAIVLRDIHPPITAEQARRRLADLREQPDFANLRGRQVNVVPLTPADPGDPQKGATALAVLVRDPNLDLRNVDLAVWDSQLAQSEWKLTTTALGTGSSFQEVSSFSSAIARTLAANATVAVLLSLLGMLVYIWMRFGSLRYSVATVVAVTHNVIICLGAIALTHYISGTRFASMLLLQDFRIDLNVIAALLTIIGYSLNDTIVILDRIRENRGKRLFATPQIVNNSINQTFSRTILTGGSTILASVILYVLGGTGIQPFAFCFLVGLLVGTYSSVAIAAPLVVKIPAGEDGGAAPRRAVMESDVNQAVPAGA
jgi:SecD/SecF fusion protein